MARFDDVSRYVLATTHMSLALVRLIQGFIFYRDTIGPILYFANISVRLNMAKDYIYITNVRLRHAPQLRDSSCRSAAGIG